MISGQLGLHFPKVLPFLFDELALLVVMRNLFSESPPRLLLLFKNAFLDSLPLLSLLFSCLFPQTGIPVFLIQRALHLLFRHLALRFDLFLAL